MTPALKSIILASIVLCALAGCSIKSAVPEFEYPEAKNTKTWPKLVSTAQLEQTDAARIDDAIKQIEDLEAQTP
ncbi:MAG: hypothetical protein COB84_09800 [Rhodobacteraceae bacterium]|nr:MAG: hypothetical protein COB84_09800 [Paracoccaceae bacterium]